MISGPANCVPTLAGWAREDGRIMMKWPFTQQEIDEWHAAQGPQMLTEADPAPEPTLETLQEDDPTGPINYYGTTKLQGEEFIRQHLPQHIILRVSAVFGEHGNNFVKTILRLAQSHFRTANSS